MAFCLVAFGAVHRAILLVVEFFVILFAIVYCLVHRKDSFPHCFWANHRYLIPFGLFLFLVLFQTIPLPGMVLSVLSAHTYTLYENIFFPQPTGFKTLSLNPSETLEGLVFASSLTLVFLLVLEISRGAKNLVRNASCFLVLLGVSEALYGLTTYLLNIPYALWFKLPQQLSGASGTFINHNHLAGHMAMMIPLCLALLLSEREGSDISRAGRVGHFVKKMAWMMCLLVLVAALILSHSRMGILSAGVGFVFFALFCGRALRFLWIRIGAVFLAIILAVVVALTLDKGLEVFKFRISQLMPGSEYFDSTRLVVWQGCIGAIRDYPLFGTGLGTFPFIYPVYAKEPMDVQFLQAHSDWLQLLMETGWIGFGLVLTSLLWFITNALRNFWRCEQMGSRLLGTGLLSGVVAISFQVLAEFNMHIPVNAIFLTVFIALTCRLVDACAS